MGCYDEGGPDGYLPKQAVKPPNDKVKVVILQVIMPNEIPSSALLEIFNVAFQNYIQEHNIKVSPIDWNVWILNKLGLDRREVT